jgi:hypothetical protein
LPESKGGLEVPKQKKITQVIVERVNLKSREFKNSKKILVSNSIVQPFETNVGGDNSALILQSLSITVDQIDQKNFSLKQLSSDKEYVKNPNILERKDYQKFENEYDKPDDKFPNENDPFYQLDDHREQNEEMVQKKNKFINSNKIAPIARNLLLSNVGNKKLKQFEVLK